VNVSQDDPRPPYRQIADDLRDQIERGELAAGQRLPAGRELAKIYGVAGQTILRAIDVLKAEGLLISHPPRGVFVASSGDGDGAQHSSEFETLMSELDVLQRDFRSQMDSFDERLKRIEKAVQSDQAPPR
jgi:GntR family transcriptional regulator